MGKKCIYIYIFRGCTPNGKIRVLIQYFIAMTAVAFEEQR